MNNSQILDYIEVAPLQELQIFSSVNLNSTSNTQAQAQTSSRRR